MTTQSVGGAGMSPEQIIEFVKQHAEESSKMVRKEMSDAQDRTKLVKDLADLSNALTGASQGDTVDGQHAAAALHKFLTDHPEANAWTSPDVVAMSLSADTIAGGMIQHGDIHINRDGDGNVTHWEFERDYLNAGKANAGHAQMVQNWAKQLGDKKDELGSEDKMAMMKLSDDAENLKNMYGLGSTLLQKNASIIETLISNMKLGEQ